MSWDQQVCFLNKDGHMHAPQPSWSAFSLQPGDSTCLMEEGGWVCRG